MSVRLSTLTDEELLRHVDNLHQPSELVLELASRLREALDEINDMPGGYFDGTTVR